MLEPGHIRLPGGETVKLGEWKESNVWSTYCAASPAPRQARPKRLPRYKQLAKRARWEKHHTRAKARIHGTPFTATWLDRFGRLVASSAKGKV